MGSGYVELCRVEVEEEKRCNMYRRTDVGRGFSKGLKRGCKYCYFNPKGPVSIRSFFFPLNSKRDDFLVYGFRVALRYPSLGAFAFTLSSIARSLIPVQVFAVKRDFAYQRSGHRPLGLWQRRYYVES